MTYFYVFDPLYQVFFQWEEDNLDNASFGEHHGAHDGVAELFGCRFIEKDFDDPEIINILNTKKLD